MTQKGTMTELSTNHELGFIFNNRSSFVNSLLHLVLSGNGVYICKIKKNKVPCHAVADKILAKWSPRELWATRDKKTRFKKNLISKKNLDCNLCRSFTKTFKATKSPKLIGYCISSVAIV